MIPKIIHYCWFGRGEMPEMVRQCIASWHHYMPEWKYILWNEENFDIASARLYVRQAYECQKYAFVSDYVRLWALEQYGGLYMDVDFVVYKPFDELMDKFEAFAGIEGSKHNPVMMGVIASKAHGEWVREMLSYYAERQFIMDDGSMDLTPNVTYLTKKMLQNGFAATSAEQEYKDLHIFPSVYFSPRKTTGEYIRSENTYCETRGLNSWAGKGNWKTRILMRLPNKWKIAIINVKRKLFG